MSAGGPVEALVAQWKLWQPRRGAKSVVAAWALPHGGASQAVWISHRSWLSFPSLDFSSVLQIPLGAALE